MGCQGGAGLDFRWGIERRETAVESGCIMAGACDENWLTNAQPVVSLLESAEWLRAVDLQASAAPVRPESRVSEREGYSYVRLLL